MQNHLSNMYNFKRVGENSFILKARYVDLISFNIVWSNDLQLPEVKFIGLAGYDNRIKSFTYRIDLSSIKIINKNIKINGHFLNVETIYKKETKLCITKKK